MNTIREWTPIGETFYTSGPDNRNLFTKEQIEKAVDEINEQNTWQEIPPNGKLRLPGQIAIAVETAVKGIPLQMPSHVAISKAFAPMGLYGIRCHYNTGPVEVYMIDDGQSCTLIMSDNHPLQVPKETMIEKWIEMGNHVLPKSQKITRRSFFDCFTLTRLKNMLIGELWQPGQAFFHNNLCFINLSDGEEPLYLIFRDDKTIGKMRLREVAAGGWEDMNKPGLSPEYNIPFEKGIQEILAATPEQILELPFIHSL